MNRRLFDTDLDRCKVNQIVSSFLGHLQPVLPLAEWTEAFGQNCLAMDAVNRQHFVFEAVRQDRVDQEVARPAWSSILTAHNNSNQLKHCNVYKLDHQ